MSGHGPHFQFGCEDVEKMTEFYTKHLGCTIKRPIREFKNIPFFAHIMGLPEHEAKGSTLHIKGTDFYLDLVQFNVPKSERATPKEPKVNDYGFASGHLCFMVDDIQKKYEELTKFGTKFISTPLKNDWFGTSLVFGRDPEGNLFELMQDHNLDEKEEEKKEE